MTSESVKESVQAKLEQLGIFAPEGDIPFLQRTFLRQREFLNRQRVQFSPQTEPAHVFKPLS